MAGEGKSLSSVNLAYSLAQLDKRVLLIDCDMRRPSLSAKLPIKKLPGLSNYLTRQVSMDEVIQTYGNSDEGAAFNVIAAGRNPPNPIELLNSGRMRKALDQLRGNYDYIILDLPPVGEVSDALVVSKLVDGILLVVRQNYCNRNVLSAAVKQFGFVETRILGVVLNCATEENRGYGRYYYRGYNRSRYEGSFITDARSASKAADQGDQTL
jgi:capsular exopolysaccharide synthesis family protein